MSGCRFCCYIWALSSKRQNLSSYILSTARAFKKIACKGGGVEYLILNFYSSRGHVQWNVQSIGGIISFRIYDSYFHHDDRGHGAGVTLPISMRVDLFFCDFPADFPSLSLFVSLFLFSFLLGIYLIFLFWPCLFTETSRAFETRGPKWSCIAPLRHYCQLYGHGGHLEFRIITFLAKFCTTII